ncbi:MAG: hypothetical protein C4531_07600 [Desulfurivibrio sp.]|jgi:hypothetical protein|nr:MAG: hypothetical protein C4531_07600 [Desulfurivibrio sp.]
MKITNLQGLQNIGQAEQKRSKPLSGADFKDLLDAELLSGVSSAAAGSATQISSAGQVPIGLRIESLSVAETTINSLESFGSALNDLRLPAEDLEPLVEALEEEAGSILDLKEKLPAGDPLAKLLDRVATVSYVEAAKYRRGDYQ